jgi:hypothetical protein
MFPICTPYEQRRERGNRFCKKSSVSAASASLRASCTWQLAPARPGSRRAERVTASGGCCPTTGAQIRSRAGAERPRTTTVAPSQPQDLAVAAGRGGRIRAWEEEGLASGGRRLPPLWVELGKGRASSPSAPRPRLLPRGGETEVALGRIYVGEQKGGGGEHLPRWPPRAPPPPPRPSRPAGLGSGWAGGVGGRRGVGASGHRGGAGGGGAREEGRAAACAGEEVRPGSASSSARGERGGGRPRRRRRHAAVHGEGGGRPAVGVREGGRVGLEEAEARGGGWRRSREGGGGHSRVG